MNFKNLPVSDSTDLGLLGMCYCAQLYFFNGFWDCSCKTTILPVASSLHPRYYFLKKGSQETVSGSCSFGSSAYPRLSLRPWCMVYSLFNELALLVTDRGQRCEDLWLYSENSALPTQKAMPISPKATVCSVCDSLGIPCAPFQQHCLSHFLPTLSHCVTTFC